MYLVAIVSSLLLGYAAAQNSNCDFFRNVAVGVKYYVYSPNYPNSYPAGVSCRWQAQCPPGYNCRLDCDDIIMPQTPSCSMDRLLISSSGDPLLTQAEYYCGYGAVSAVSTGQRMTIGLLTSAKTTGGRFMCELTAQRITTQPTCSCGYRRLDRIVGGEETRPKEFPMMAGIVTADTQSIECGAVIIDTKYVLTAAHCVANQQLDNLGVVVGEHDTSTGSESMTQGFRVAQVIIHPQYTSSNYDFDVAILKINGQIKYNDYVAPVCLPFKYVNNDFTGSKVTLLGWGTLSPGGPTSNVLMKVDLNVISQATCRQSYPDLTPRQMCTYKAGKDACQRDSGGPALYTDPQNGLLYAAGVISYGRFCASNEPGVNARITELLKWIVTNAPANYCMK
ncbi:venom serine protease-like [Nymphalis io]|uniref:venom serine protease-like n=1 Tax=Inachis io TaxID=171585 RepID=UPI002169E4E6|nr:venom serine protease-like [Nymphalis io]XP_050356175.1 venom serine protease-like [Nymphalis io]XP_050356176.1 venom serine protease-like [Nymphalis io]XP_050356177.1 venom serine protease-like [Nymphalis io]